MYGKSKLAVKMNGKEYLDYVKYQNKIKLDYGKFLKEYKLPILIVGCLVATITAFFIGLDIGTPNPEPIKITGIGILKFLGIATGLAWIFHGFGFIIIRR